MAEFNTKTKKAKKPKKLIIRDALRGDVSDIAKDVAGLKIDGDMKPPPTASSPDQSAIESFSFVLESLEAKPREFEEFGKHNPVYSRERYWFMIVLKDTEFTQGTSKLDGWSSAADVRRARGEELEEEDLKHREFIIDAHDRDVSFDTKWPCTPPLLLPTESDKPPPPTQLYQTITKEHLDPDNKTTTAQWDDFVGKFQDNFARECSEIAQEMFDNHNDEESA